MTEITRVAVDTSKHVFTVHAVGAAGQVVRRGNLRRGQVAAFFQALPPVEVAMEACGGSHHWARTLQAMGHRVRLIPPRYVKPFVRRGKNDAADAEAISEAAVRPRLARVPDESAEQQAGAMLLSVRELLVGQRTQLANALRGHAAEFGLVAPQGGKGLARLREDAATDAALPPLAAQALALLGAELDRLDARLDECDAKLLARHKANPLSRRLAEVPGIGPITALTLAVRVDAGQFQSGRHLAAWLGLTPRDHSTGGKQRLGGISRAGDERLRSLLVLGATAVIRHAKPGQAGLLAWLEGLLKRKPRKLAAVALANKVARIAWAMMASGEGYRRPKPATA